MTPAFSNVRVLSLLLVLDLFYLSYAIGQYRDAQATETCAVYQSRPEIRTPSPREAVAILNDARLHD